MKAKHTPEPWEAFHVVGAGWQIRMKRPFSEKYKALPVCSMSWWQFDVPGVMDDEISGATAKRIVACVNALAGIPDPAAYVSENAALKLRIEAYREALERIKGYIDNPPGDNEGDFETLAGWMHAEAMQALQGD